MTLMIAPYDVRYGLKEFWAALHGLARPLPSIASDWLPFFRRQGLEVFPTHRGREAEYALLRALHLPVGARVGVPVLTHPVVWQTILAAGMQPVFLDTDPFTLGLSLTDLERKNAQLDCLILVHTFGYPADFDAVARIMGQRPILEDCAHTLGSTYYGRPLGTLGTGGFFTFLFSKPLSAGGGGCAVVSDEVVAKRVKALLHEGRHESLLQGVTHALANFSIALAYKRPFYPLLTLLTYNQRYRELSGHVPYPVSSLLQMRRSDWAVVSARVTRWNSALKKKDTFWDDIRNNAPSNWYIPPEPAYGSWNHWLLPVCPTSEESALQSVSFLRKRGVGARMIYRYSPDGARYHGYKGDCPVAERLARTVFILPAHAGLSARSKECISFCVRALRDGTGSKSTSKSAMANVA